MKSFACGHVVPDCQAAWVCSTEEEMLSLVAAHAAHSHEMSEVPAAVVAQVRARIVEVAG